MQTQRKLQRLSLAIVLACAACGGDPEPEEPAPEPKVEATIEEYPVEGQDCDEVRGVLFPESGSHPGKTTVAPEVPPFGFAARADGQGNCILTLSDVDTKFTLRIRIPKWNAPEDADTRCFDKFIADLKKHEEAHADAFREHTPKKLAAAKAALEGLEVPLTGPCEVQDGQVILSEAQGKQLDAAVAAALAGSDAYKEADAALNKAQDAVEANASLAAVLDCDCP